MPRRGVSLTRFRWLRRFFRRLKRRSVKTPEGIGHGYKLADPSDPYNTSAYSCAGQNREGHVTEPPMSATAAQYRPDANMFPESQPSGRHTEGRHWKFGSKKGPVNPEHVRSNTISTQTDAETEAWTDNAYMEWLRWEFAQKYCYKPISQENGTGHEGRMGDPWVDPGLEGCIQNSQKATPAIAPETAEANYTFSQALQTNYNSPHTSTRQPLAEAPLETNCNAAHDYTTNLGTCRTNRSVHFIPEVEDLGEIAVDYQNTRNQLHSQDVSRRGRRRRKHRRHHRLGDLMYRKLLRPKGYAPLKEASEDRAEIYRLELEFEETALPPTTKRNKALRDTTQLMRRASECARDGLQDMSSGLSRLQLGSPSIRTPPAVHNRILTQPYQSLLENTNYNTTGDSPQRGNLMPTL